MECLRSRKQALRHPQWLFCPQSFSSARVWPAFLPGNEKHTRNSRGAQRACRLCLPRFHPSSLFHSIYTHPRNSRLLDMCLLVLLLNPTKYYSLKFYCLLVCSQYRPPASSSLSPSERSPLPQPHQPSSQIDSVMCPHSTGARQAAQWPGFA